MKSIRRILLLVAALALLLPATASAANWKKEGTEIGMQWAQEGAPMESGEGSLALEGTLSWNSALGGISCPVSGKAALTPGGGGEFTDVAVVASSCTMSGQIAEVCENDTITAVEVFEQPLAIAAKEIGGKRVIEVPTMSIVYVFKGGECEEEVGAFSVTGKQIATPDNSNGIGNLKFSGSMKLYGLKIGFLGSVNGTSSLSVSPAGKYGITNEWHVAVEGNIGWNNAALGAVNCSLAGTFVLEAGSKGKFTSISTPWGCTSWGIYGTCTALTANSPTIVNEGTHIAIQNIELTGVGGSCKLGTISGSLKAETSKPNEISVTSLSGTLGGRTWTGSLNWTPAGVYGL